MGYSPPEGGATNLFPMMFMQSLNQYIRFRGFIHVFFDKSKAVCIEILCVIADELQIKCLKKQGRAILIYFGDVI